MQLFQLSICTHLIISFHCQMDTSPSLTRSKNVEFIGLGIKLVMLYKIYCLLNTKKPGSTL